MGSAPKTAEAQAIADEVYAEFTGEDVDKVGASTRPLFRLS
jgi:hypothetical protein